jgi:Holliday junction resolvase
VVIRFMSGAKHRRKGNRIERELVELHRALGVHAERYPLSGASRFRGSGHDVDIYVLGLDEPPLVAEVKARKRGGGFVTLEKWIGGYDALFLRRNNAKPLVVAPWQTWAALLQAIPRSAGQGRQPRPAVRRSRLRKPSGPAILPCTKSN